MADEDDQFHKKAVGLVQELKGAKTISDLVLSESVTGVGGRLGHRSGKEVFENLLYDPLMKVVFLNKRLVERSLQIYVRYGVRLSFADAVSVRIMYDGQIRTIASFDSDFDVVEGITRLH